jgi:gluconokinase
VDITGFRPSFCSLEGTESDRLLESLFLSGARFPPYKTAMSNVPGLRSPYARVGRLVYFGRMLDKIRLNAAGRLPPEYQANLGDATNFNLFDARCCRFLGLKYADIVVRTLQGGTDEGVLSWCETTGTPRTDEECAVWSSFMMKIGWRDQSSGRLQERIAQYGLAGKDISTFFDMIDWDEGRDPAATRPWK